MNLKILVSTNHTAKYADDASLLVPEKNDTDLESKFHNVSEWVADHELLIDVVKTKELVLYRPNVTREANWH